MADRTDEPRVHLGYQIAHGNELHDVTLPFVVGVLGDFSGRSDPSDEPSRTAGFVGIDSGSFGRVMKEVAPELRFGVPNLLTEIGDFPVELQFRDLADFEPAGVVRQLGGLRTWHRDAQLHGNLARAEVRARVQKQLEHVLHHPSFRHIEARWRGLWRLVEASSRRDGVEVRLLDVSKDVLAADLARSGATTSMLFREVHEREYRTPGGKPYTLLIGDYEFGHDPTDVKLLAEIASVAAVSLTPFVAGASPRLFGLADWQQLTELRHLDLDDAAHGEFRGFQRSSDAAFVALTMPRVLARPPHASRLVLDGDVMFDERGSSSSGWSVWSNAAFAFAEASLAALAGNGTILRGRGQTFDARVEHLPMVPSGAAGSDETICPTEITITDRREAELLDHGLLPLCHFRDTSFAVFPRARSLYMPEFAAEAAGTDLGLSLLGARFVQFFKVMARDRIGGFADPGEIAAYLSRWVANYVDETSSSEPADAPARRPLREATVRVDLASDGSAYDCAFTFRPALGSLTPAPRVTVEFTLPTSWS